MVSIAEGCLVVVLFSYHTVIAASEDPTIHKMSESQKLCDKVAEEPYFEPEMIIGRPWRVYYMWNMNLENRCIDMQFQLATPKIIRRVYYDMSQYLESQPAWGAASLLMYMGRAKREMLLFSDQGPAGKFLGVPNTVRDGSLSPTKSGVPLMTFQMKLLRSGKYLFVVDCMGGLASLAARYDDDIDRDDILKAGKPMNSIYGTGFPACVANLKKDEELIMV